MTRLAQAAIVIPARDEETLLPGCLDALAAAVENSPVPTQTIVVLDRRTDTSVEICRSRGIDTIEVDYANVSPLPPRRRDLSRPPRTPGRRTVDRQHRRRQPAALDWIAEPVRLADEGADALHSPVVVTTTTLRVKIQPPDAREMRRRIRS